MQLTNKKVLVTGGNRGIGLSIAKAFAEAGSQVILAGRNEDTLATSAAAIEGATYIVCDVSDEADVTRLVKKIGETGGKLDILVNNAGVGRPQPLDAPDGVYDNAKYEMEINYLGVLRLTEKLLPFLKESKEAAIINIQSIVSYVPLLNIATYSATKAALHSYSQSLRLTLQKSNPHIRVFEVFPPFVDTDLTRAYDVEKLSPKEVADDIIAAVEKEEYNIRNGVTKELYKSFHAFPDETLKQFNADRTEAVAETH